jgi:hypothetical protein
MKTAVLAACLLLVACGATVKVSNPRSAVIHAGGVRSAQALADTECGKHKRHAQFQQERPEFIFTFHCVE